MAEDDRDEATTQPAGFTTRAIHAGETTDPTTRAHAPPIYQTAAFAFESGRRKEEVVDAAMAWEPDSFFYSRTANPTTTALEQKVAALEGAEAAVVCASGMAAVANTVFSLLRAGDHCVASADVFIITRFFLDDVCARKGIEVTRVDVCDLDAVRAAVRPETRALFVESLSNPHLNLADVEGLARIAAETGAVLVVDNTFLSPACLRPLEHGADLVLHSATKYLSGHGDTVCGVVAGSRTLTDPIRYELDALGSAPSPFNSWLVARGVRTLPIRMEVHSRNALGLARFLEGRPEVERVRYPGPREPPAPRGGAAAARAGLRRHARVPTRGRRAGDVRVHRRARDVCDRGQPRRPHTLVYPNPKRDNLIRVSVGCEDLEDIVADFETGLRATRR